MVLQGGSKNWFGFPFTGQWRKKKKAPEASCVEKKKKELSEMLWSRGSDSVCSLCVDQHSDHIVM